jgi:hypothetical protein
MQKKNQLQEMIYIIGKAGLRKKEKIKWDINETIIHTALSRYVF